MTDSRKKPHVEAIRHTIEDIERDNLFPAGDPMLARLKDTLLLRLMERDEAPLPTIDDLTVKSNQ